MQEWLRWSHEVSATCAYLTTVFVFAVCSWIWFSQPEAHRSSLKQVATVYILALVSTYCLSSYMMFGRIVQIFGREGAMVRGCWSNGTIIGFNSVLLFMVIRDRKMKNKDTSSMP